MPQMFPFDAGAFGDLTDELDRWRAVLDLSVLSRRWEGRIRRDLEAEAVAASVGMEQVPVTVDEVRRILAGERVPSVGESDQELVLGYKAAMEFILRRADDPGFQWNRELIVGIHDRVLAGNYGLGAGRLATNDRWVVDPASGHQIFEPAPWAEVPKLVDDVCSELEGSTLHPALRSAWLHIVTAAIHPFSDGNGRVSRVLASLAMYRGGFKTREFCSLEEWWGRHLSDYYRGFDCLGDRFDPSVDVSPFIQTHVRAQLSQVRALELREQVERQLWTAMESVVEDAGLPIRVANATWDAFFDRSVTPAYYIPLADVSRATATNDLKAATSAGLLTARSGGRSRHYVAGDQLYGPVGQAVKVDVSNVANPRERIISALTKRVSEQPSRVS